jgi:tRNA (guanine-N7-)-methyltransferase
MHGYTWFTHGEGHEVLYANHNVYVNEGSPEEDCISNFYENNIWKLTKQLRIFDLN